MGYEKHTWETGEWLSADGMNHIEEGIEELSDAMETVSGDATETANKLAGLHAAVDLAQVHLEHLQSDVDQKAAADDLAEMQAVLEPLVSHLADLQDDVKKRAEAIELAGLQSEVTIVENHIASLREAVLLKADTVALAGAVADLTQDIIALRGDLSDLNKIKAEKNELGAVIADVNDIETTLENIRQLLSSTLTSVSEMAVSIQDKVAKPQESPNGINGQLLKTNGDGTTTWVNPAKPSDEQIGNAVSEWLGDHPEATTTVADGSITAEKLDASLRQSISENGMAIDSIVLASAVALEHSTSTYHDEDIRWQADYWQKHESKFAMYASYFASSDGIGFLYFADPHIMSPDTYGNDQTFMLSMLKEIRTIYENSPATHVICAGDWGTDPEGATGRIKYGGRVVRMMKNQICERCYTVLGNHDILNNDERITSRIWFDSDVGYDILHWNDCDCYMFDSGLNTLTMSTYRWTQVNWFGQHLALNIKPHVYGIIHIAQWLGEKSDLYLNLTALANAFNRRTSITLNGIIYNYANATGTFHFMMIGHDHRDLYEITNSIPTIYTATSLNGLELDACYADFSSHVLHCVRFGNGESRDLQIIPNGGYQIVV